MLPTTVFKWTLKASFFPWKQRESESLASLWLTAVILLADQIIWTILTRIVIRLF